MRSVTALTALALLAAAPAYAQQQPQPGGSIVETLGGDPGGLGDAPSTVQAQATGRLYSQLLSDEQGSEAELQMFVTMMPKGADLHHHYSGSLYAETYLDWLRTKGWKIDPATLQVDRKGDVEGSITVDELYANAELYRKLLSAWSIKDYQEEHDGAAPPDQAFFNAFAYFGTFASYTYDVGLAQLRDRARDENVLYIETMLSGVRFWFSDEQLDAQLRATAPNALDGVFRDLVDQFEADAKYRQGIDRFVDEVAKIHQGIDTDDFTLRYQTYVYRDTTPSRVFAGLAAGFAAAQRSPLVVGVNMVGPENGITAVHDYGLHMRMVRYLKQRYPGVKVALHAGELVKGMVPPEDLRFHIRDAVEVAGAIRIGHAIDLPSERDPIGLMRTLRERGIPVEINLTSNAFILGVEGREHPLRMFLANKVPMVICTDDSGVSRNDLSHEFMLLASRYELTYPQLKHMVYDSIRYGFLADADKQRLQTKLDQQFAAFEQQMAEYAEARGN